MRQAIDRKLKGFTKEESYKVNRIIDQTFSTSHEEEYKELLDILKKECPTFIPYFVRSWHSCRKNWVGCFFRHYVIFGNLTTNFVESRHSKMKLSVGRDTSIPCHLEEIVKLSIKIKKHFKVQEVRAKLKLKKALISSED